MVNTAEKKYARAFTMRVDEVFLAALDESRGAELPVLNRADYIRRLVFVAVARKHERDELKPKAKPNRAKRRPAVSSSTPVHGRSGIPGDQRSTPRADVPIPNLTKRDVGHAWEGSRRISRKRLLVRNWQP
jgi:hypothetical protein